MKILLLGLILFCATDGYSQTKKETEDWIKEKIELYAFAGGGVEYDYKVEFTEGYMILTDFIKLETTEFKQTMTVIYWIPIKELSKIFFEEKKHNTWLYLKIKENKPLIKRETVELEEVKYTDELNIILSKSINESNLKSRMGKAFNHLIKLYGGIVVEEKF